ncbi:MAG: DUF488 family protein [Rectinemataceae bacterium]|nr:DUF488 family protein [Rectinemataceae bacterium]
MLETYLGNVENVKKMNPGAVIINVTRGAGSVLGPSWDLLNDWRAKRITWDEYVRRFVEEMGNSKCKVEMLRIGNLAKTKDVYIVCFERKGNCHRFLLVDMIKELLMEDAGRRVNRLVTVRPDLVKACYNNIAKALREEA